MCGRVSTNVWNKSHVVLFHCFVRIETHVNLIASRVIFYFFALIEIHKLPPINLKRIKQQAFLLTIERLRGWVCTHQRSAIALLATQGRAN